MKGMIIMDNRNITTKEYPISYICCYRTPYNSQEFEAVSCTDIAAAMEKAKTDLSAYHFVDSISFGDDETKVELIPDDIILSGGMIKVTSGCYIYQWHTDNIFSVLADKLPFVICNNNVIS